eukprot:CAMPEP_0201661326 /NCGR_PEP_ID=MMETSP0494-20130426/3724_1 /ASSEMBLY_ACC=CAM_ASM_000839 /TAXON_ID=420259 /ORGANISM="Thalassiosira gravida, Strain GMp14c1" /LENGTH=657 /DNA_ID=CAMNT_0048139409 /DNA_START=52 /DNA_END=2025 /DNA_ORIENTATION=-
MAILYYQPASTITSLALVICCLAFPPQQIASSESSLFTGASSSTTSHHQKSSSSRGNRPSEEHRCCFLSSVGCTPKLRQKTQQLLASSSSFSEDQPSHPLTMESSNECEFNLQKARLMARFSSVAYEDPPNTKKMVDTSDIVEQFVDDYGVSITRPIPQSNDNNNNNNNVENENDNNNSHKTNHNLNIDAQNDNNTWNMAHMDAMSPRPLMLMLSNCNTSTMSNSEENSSELERARFQWVALATSQETSAQFDVWRITSPSSSSSSSSSSDATAKDKEIDESDAILVIAFRGTRLLSAVDLLTDIQLRQDMIQCSDFGFCMDDDGDDGSNKLMAHSGFLGAYTSIRSSLLQLLSDNVGTYDRIWFTGHSLGAAMATLAVVDVGSIMNGDSQSITVTSKISSSSAASASEVAPNKQTLHIPKAKSLSSYLFGTPRVGNRTFANRLARLQQHQHPQQPNIDPILQEYYRVNTPGDAVVFLPRGKVVNRLDIDYVHAGASVFLPTLSSSGESEGVGGEGEDDRRKNGYSRKMMQLEEDTIKQINQRIFESDDGNNGGTMETTITTSNQKDNNNRYLSNIRIYPKGDQPPDPLSEIDPSYSGFFPLDPRTWTSSSFQNFVLGETVRSFRILRGGFVRNHQLKTYEDGLCLASQDDVIVVEQ